MSDGTLAFPSFIIGGMFGATLPSAPPKESSRLTKVAYPPEIKTTELEMKYKKPTNQKLVFYVKNQQPLAPLGELLL